MFLRDYQGSFCSNAIGNFLKQCQEKDIHLNVLQRSFWVALLKKKMAVNFGIAPKEGRTNLVSQRFWVINEKTRTLLKKQDGSQVWFRAKRRLYDYIRWRRAASACRAPC